MNDFPSVSKKDFIESGIGNLFIMPTLELEIFPFDLHTIKNQPLKSLKTNSPFLILYVEEMDETHDDFEEITLDVLKVKIIQNDTIGFIFLQENDFSNPEIIQWKP